VEGDDGLERLGDRHRELHLMRSLWLALGLFLAAIPGAVAQVAFDAAATVPASSTGSSGSSQTLASMTVGSTANRALIVKLTGYTPSGGITPVASVTWGTQSLTLISGFSYSPAAFAGSSYRVELWGLVNPTSGNQTITVNYGGAWNNWSISAVSFSGVDQTGGATTFYNSTASGGLGSPSSVSVTSAVGDAATDVIVAIGQTISGSSQTQDYSVALGAAGSHEMNLAAPAFGWSIGSPGYWASAATAIKAVTGGGAAITSPAPIMVRPMVQADQYFYFNCATGSNSNSGTASAPFADPVKAYQVAQRTLDLGGQWRVYAVNQGSCSGVNWTFNGPPPPGSPYMPSFIVKGGSISGHMYLGGGAAVQFDSMSIAPTAGLNFVDAAQATAWLTNVSATTANGSEILHVVGAGTVGSISGSFTLNGGGGTLIGIANAEDVAQLVISAAVTFSGSPAWSSFASQADYNGMIDWTGSTCSGAHSGPGSQTFTGGQIIGATGCP
jgi:hypothetical protein